MHASDAAALFITADEDNPIEHDTTTDGGGDGDEQYDVNMFDSRGGSPVDEGDPDAQPEVSWYLFF